jgi:stage IV sporulation protein FB
MHIKFDWKIIIFVLFFFIIKTWKIYLLFLIYALIHELAHLIVGEIVGFTIQKINIMPLGAYISFKIGIENYNKKFLKGTYCSIKKIVVAMAGPVINIIFVFIYIRKYTILSYINLIIAVFNLLPIYPLDGGRILKHLLIILYGRRKGLKYINLISNIVASIVVILGILLIINQLNYTIITTILYLSIIRYRENKIYKMKERIYELLEIL